MPSASILPATPSPEIRFVPMTGLTTVAPSPVREALRFASIAPHILPCREAFAERFSEGSSLLKTWYKNSTADSSARRALGKRKHRHCRQVRINSRNLINITTTKPCVNRVSNASHVSVTFRSQGVRSCSNNAQPLH